MRHTTICAEGSRAFRLPPCFRKASESERDSRAITARPIVTPMSPSSCLLALLSLSAADALRGGGGAMAGGALALKSGAQSQRSASVTPRSVVVLRGARKPCSAATQQQ